MDQTPPTPGDGNPAAKAFDGLCAEVSLLRRGVEQLTNERRSVPDYSPTLEVIDKRLEEVRTWARKVSERPGVRLGPKDIGREIAEAAIESRASDHAKIEEAAARMEAATSRIDATIARSRLVIEQRREIRRNRIAFTAAGMTLWAVFPGMIARALPASWAVPARIAARTLRTDMWGAGQDMMAKAAPEGRRHILVLKQDRRCVAEPINQLISKSIPMSQEDNLGGDAAHLQGYES